MPVTVKTIPWTRFNAATLRLAPYKLRSLAKRFGPFSAPEQESIYLKACLPWACAKLLVRMSKQRQRRVLVVHDGEVVLQCPQKH